MKLSVFLIVLLVISATTASSIKEQEYTRLTQMLAYSMSKDDRRKVEEDLKHLVSSDQQQPQCHVTNVDAHTLTMIHATLVRIEDLLRNRN